MKNTFNDKKEWINAIKNMVQEKKCKTLLLSGASAAGKTFMSEELAKVLSDEGKKVFIFSTDNFYKGITRNILDKAEKNFYNGHIDNKDKIIEIVRSHTIDLQFQEKYNDESVKALKEKLKDVSDPMLADHLKTEFERINFDEPAAVDLITATEFLNTLILEPKKYVCLPEYSFLTGEYKLLEKNNVKGEDYDFFIMEGIFSLNDIVIKNLKIDAVKSFVECSLNTLLIRKLNRDITKGRSSMTKQMIFLTYLNTIIPAYFNYILPTRDNADLIYLNNYSGNETHNILCSSQEKYYIDEKYIKKLKDFELLKKSKQVDYFFSFKNDYNIISLREENGELLEFNYKSIDSGLINRTSESFKLKGELTKEYQDAKEFSQLFINAGFDFTTTVRKERSIYNFSDVFFRFDEVRSLGNFIEFVGGNPTQIEYVKKHLHLTKKCEQSYYILMNESTHINRNIKLKISKIPEEVTCTPKRITQYYLDTSKDYCNFIIKNILNPVNYISEANIRIDDNEYVLSVKYGRNYVRQKKEKRIEQPIAQMLIDNFAINLTEKDSYKVYEDKHHKIDIDKYDNIIEDSKPLIICTMNFDNENKKDALNFLLSKVNIDSYEDITENLSYKNRNLSKHNIVKK